MNLKNVKKFGISFCYYSNLVELFEYEMIIEMIFFKKIMIGKIVDE